MKLGKRTKVNMLSSKNVKAEVCRHIAIELPPPSLNSMKCRESANYRPIFMIFSTQTEDNLNSSKNAKPEVCRHFERWPPS
jgi:hypothetical protein